MKTIKIVYPVIVILFSFLPIYIFAQDKKMTLQECIEYATENNLSMKSGRIQIQKSKDLQGTAFNIERTGLSLSQDMTTGGSGNNLAISQGFDFPTVYTSRRGLLKAETDLERSNFEVSRNELIRTISSIYYELLYARENIKILKEQNLIYERFLFLASTKYKLGETSRLEEMNAERLLNENKLDLQKAEKDFQSIQLMLQRWMNMEELIEPMEQNLPVMPTSLRLSEFNAEQTPVAATYEKKKAVIQKNLRVIKQGYIPSFNFALQNQLLIKGMNPYNIQRDRFSKGNFMGFQVGVSMPLFFGEQRAKTRAAKREIEIIQIQQQETLLSLNKEYQAKLNEHKKAKSSLDYYASVGNKQAEEITRISQISYEKGEINYIEYIQNLKSAVEINLQYINAINDYNQSTITLNFMQGYP